jgi:hypothetical protein
LYVAALVQSALDKLGFQVADGSRGSSTIQDIEEDRSPCITARIRMLIRRR